MPSIPVYNSPQVDRAAVSGAKQQTGGVNAVAFGASDTFDQAERMASTYVQQQEKEGERKAAEEALRAQSGFQREVIGKQNEWRQRQGKNAEGIDKEADAWMAETAGKYIEELKDPRAIQLFDQKAMQQRNNMLDWSTGHVTQQREIALDVELNSAKQVAIDTAINDSRPEIVSQSIADIQQKNAFNAKRKGYDDTWIQAQNTKDISKMHDQILQNAIDQDSVGGVSGYLQAHGDSIDKGTRAKAEKWVHNKVIDETAGAYADTLIGSGVSYSEALAGAREKFSGDDEDKYVRRIKERYGEAQEASRLYAKDAVDTFEKTAYKEGVDKLTDEQLNGLAEHDAGAASYWKALRDDYRDKKAAGELYPKYSKPADVAAVNKKIMGKEITSPQQLSAYKGILSESDYRAAEKGFADNQKVTDTQLEETYMMMAPQTLRDKKEKDWTIEDHNNLFAFKKAAREAVRDNANPDYVGRFSAEWWRKGKNPESGFRGFFQDETTKGEAALSGKPFVPTEDVPVNAITQPGLEADAKRKAHDEALQWIAENPDDPRVPDIKARLGL